MIYGHLKEKFLKPDKKAIINMFLELKKKYSDNTIMDYENVMKRFYKWLSGNLSDFLNIRYSHKLSHDKRMDLITRGTLKG
jgi:site-specific recombinase XerD